MCIIQFLKMFHISSFTLFNMNSSITYYQNNDLENLQAYQLYFVFEEAVVEIGYYGAANVNASRIKKSHGI